MYACHLLNESHQVDETDLDVLYEEMKEETKRIVFSRKGNIILTTRLSSSIRDTKNTWGRCEEVFPPKVRMGLQL